MYNIHRTNRVYRRSAYGGISTKLNIESQIMTTQETNQNTHHDSTLAFSCTPRHSDRSPGIVGTQRRNLFQNSSHFPNTPYSPIPQGITAPIMQNKLADSSRGDAPKAGQFFQPCAPFYAKQTQFPKPKNHRKPFALKDLHQYYPPPGQKKQTQTNPIRRGEAFGEIADPPRRTGSRRAAKKHSPGLSGLSFCRLSSVFRRLASAHIPHTTYENNSNPVATASSPGGPQFPGQNTYGGEWCISSMIWLRRAWIGPK